MWREFNGPLQLLLGVLNKRGFEYKDIDRVQAAVDDLAFYEDGALLRVTTPHDRKYFIMHRGGLLASQVILWIDGTSDPIHRANRTFGLKLTDDNVIDYLRFHNGFLVGDCGDPFFVIDTMKGYVIEDKDPPADMTPKITGKDEDGFLVSAFIRYSWSVFAADFKVHSRNGLVEMLEDRQLGDLVLLQ